ncbi:MAG: mechanosensitive ion channel family protein [Chitinophagales bacterium]
MNFFNFIILQKDISSYIDTAINTTLEKAPGILGAILVLIIGWWIIGAIARSIGKALDRSGIDPTVKSVVMSAVNILLKIMLLLAAASTMGIQTTSFVAVLGAVGLAAGFALQGSLANLAGGILITLFRPFKIGDYIKAQGVEGFVKDLQLLVTVIETPDMATHYLPNGALANGNITNASEQGTARLHIPVGIGYGENIQNARNVLVDVMKKHPLVLNNPAPSVAVVNLGGSSVDLDLRPWCNAGDVPGVTVEVLEAAKIALDKANIDIPFPQQVLHQAK